MRPREISDEETTRNIAILEARRQGLPDPPEAEEAARVAEAEALLRRRYPELMPPVLSATPTKAAGRGLDTDVPPPGEPAPEPESVVRPFAALRVLDGDAPDPPDVIVSDLLVDRDITMWAAHGGAGKSVLALSVAICVVLGRLVFGSLPVRRAGPVLIVAPEDGQAAVRMMLDALIAGMGLDAADRAVLAADLYLVPDDQPVNLLLDTRRLAATAQACGAVLVVLDPLRNLLGEADEDKSAIAGPTLDALRRDVCRGKVGAAVLLLLHPRKPGKDSGADSALTVHDLRGSGGWPAGARLVFGLSNLDNRLTLTGLKANRLRADLRHELRLDIMADPDQPTRWLQCTVTDLNTALGSESFTPGLARALTANETTALTTLDDRQEPGLRLSWSAWLERSGLAKSTLGRIKIRLIDAGLADAVNTGRLAQNRSPVFSYGITDAGRAVLALRPGTS